MAGTRACTRCGACVRCGAYRSPDAQTSTWRTLALTLAAVAYYTAFLFIVGAAGARALGATWQPPDEQRLAAVITFVTAVTLTLALRRGFCRLCGVQNAQWSQVDSQ